jgi:hypothetical protein
MDWFPTYNSLTNGDQEGYGTFFWHLLPYIEQDPLYKSGVWNRGANPSVAGANANAYWSHGVFANGLQQPPLKTYTCPSDPTQGTGWATYGSYAVNFQVTQWAGSNARMPATFQDGTSNTILITERLAQTSTSGAGVTNYNWALYWGWDNNTPMFAYYVTGPASRFQTSINANTCNPNYACTPHGVAGIQACLADASVRSITGGISGTTWWAACTPAAGDQLGTDW